MNHKILKCNMIMCLIGIILSILNIFITNMQLLGFVYGIYLMTIIYDIIVYEDIMKK